MKCLVWQIKISLSTQHTQINYYIVFLGTRQKKTTRENKEYGIFMKESAAVFLLKENSMLLNTTAIVYFSDNEIRKVSDRLESREDRTNSNAMMK